MDQALTTSIRHERAGGALRALTLASVLALFALITLGGVVRITDSGLGCPDWPFCHGKVLPSTDAATPIEYSHRMVAAITGLLIFATALVIWRSHRSERWLLRPVTIAVFLLIVQVVLGGITVQTELNDGLVMAHLAVAEALLAVMIVVSVVTWSGLPSVTRSESGQRHKMQRPTLVLMAGVATFGLILTGAYVQASGATGACGDSWPLCDGELLPGGRLAMIHMLHRILSLAVGVAIVAGVLQAWSLRDRQPFLKIAALAVAGLFVAQMAVGGINVLMAFNQATNVLHISAATAVWASLVLLAALAYPVPAANLGGSDAD